MRQNFNYHTHTYRCGHASLDSDESYVLSAIKAGFKTLGMSDHAPYPDLKKERDRMNFERIEDYLSSMNALKEKYADQIDLKIGFEMEYFDEYRDYLDYLLSRADYLILGQHYPSRFAEVDYCYGGQREVTKEDVEKYGELIEKGLHTGKYLYLAHPDYFMGSQTSFDDTCRKTTHRIFKAAEETDTPVEVNIALAKRRKREIDGKTVYPYPLREVWQIASQYKLRVLYGYDAHDSALLQNTEIFDIADSILEGIDLNFIKEPLL
ncbi:MAG: histidinol-phosphatase [Erysipelotrichaceae bacterium]|nr:histidinol-phosphatase [Erysipelotrichaceae bacterium]